MAIFNPDPPAVNPQDFTKEFHAIQQPESDKSLGLTLSTIGEGITGAVGLGKEIQEDILKDKVRTGVEGLRDNYTAALTKVRDQQIAGLVPDPKSMAAAGIATGTLGPDDQPNVPGGLQAGLDKASALGTAMAQNGGGGKANDTLYTGALNSLAKNLRNQYPGSKDFIDAQIAKVSGKDPANAFYENLLTDINHNSTNAQTEHNKVSTLIRDNLKLPNAPVIQSLWDTGKISSVEVSAWVNKYLGADYQRQSEISDRSNFKGRFEDLQTDTEQKWAKTASTAAQSAIDITRIAGGTQTAQGLVDVIQKANAEGTKVDPIKLEQGIQGLTGLLANVTSDLNRKANQPDANGNTTTSIIGPEKVQAHIAQQVRPIQEYIKYLSDEKLGFAHTALHQATAITEQAERDLLTDKSSGGQMAIIAGVAKIAPQWGDVMYKAGLLSNLDKNLMSKFNETLGRATTQLDPLNPATIKQDFQEAKANGVKASTRLFDNYLNVPKIIADPKAPDEVKLNVAKYAFNPKNWGMMDELKMDYTNQKGQFVPGKYSAYDRMLSTDIIDGMDKLRKTGGEGKVAWDNMKAWGENEFPVLFREDLQNIVRANQLPQTPAHLGSAPQTSDAAPPLKNFDIHWDNDNNRFLELPTKGRNSGAQDPNNQFALSVNPIIRRVNSAMAQLSDVQKRDGGNPSAYLLKVLNDTDPALAEIINPMKSAIISSHDKTLQKLEDTFRKGQDK
jgi:hypothetical protein